MAEPVHSTGYLPMYIAMAKGYFAESDIVVKIVTIETGGGHTNAVLSAQAFAFIARDMRLVISHESPAAAASLRRYFCCADTAVVATSVIAPGPGNRTQATSSARHERKRGII